MSKYIDAEKLKAIIKVQIKERKEWLKDIDRSDRQDQLWQDLNGEDMSILQIIESLLKEQPMPDSTKLIELWHEDKEMLKEKDFRNDQWRLAYNAFMCGFGRGIAVNKQEQPEELVLMAESFLEVLSKTPYNNKPITDAQAIVKQLLVFLNNPKSYNPDTLSQQEQPEVDLVAKLKNFIRSGDSGRSDLEIARHFYELGLNARKEE